MEATSTLQTSLYAGAASAYIVQFLQKWSKTPWITDHTKWVTVGVRLTLACVSAAGVSWAWAAKDGGGHTLTIAIPGLTSLLIGVWHLFGQYATTHAFGGVLKATELKPPAVPVEPSKA